VLKAHTGAIGFMRALAGHHETVKTQVLNPLSDSRWDDLVARHPRASAFHQRGWLEALARSYGYEPFVLTSAAADKPLRDGVVLCRVSSWITGTRLVSLPFADHCEPLLNEEGESLEFMSWLRAECHRRRCRYVELRPLPTCQDVAYGLQPEGSYCYHELDITPTLGEIFRQMHNNSFRRKIRRAERERLSYETGRSEELVTEFYRLLVITRRRHQLVPQPRAWFRNLVECMGDNVQISLVRKSGAPIAAILTLRHASCIVYKYGCSDVRFHHLGGMPFLFWKLIEESKADGVEKIDLGRSDWNNEGLIAFKDRLGTTRRMLTYYRYTNLGGRDALPGLGSLRSSKTVFSLPDAVLSAIGRVLYRHVG
jgi:CelD/BcsL family acetyltransferase involved in cellulose biosynthesis